MAKVLGQCAPSVSLNQTPTSGIFKDSAIAVNETIQTLFRQSGVAADQVDLLHAKVYTFAASTAQTIDLTACPDVFGASISFARVRLVAIKVKSTVDAASLTVGGAASNAFEAWISAGGTVTVYSSTANVDGSLNNHGYLVFSAPNTTGMPVDATHKLLKMLPSAHAFDAVVIIAGCSA